MDLTDREHTVVTNIWGGEMPTDLREVDTELLWEMHDKVSQAVQLSYEDTDVDSLGILLPLETKLTQVLFERIPSVVD